MAINVVHAPSAQAVAGTANAAGLALYGRQRQQELESQAQQAQQLAEQSRQFDVGQENTQKRALMSAELDIYGAQLGEYGAQFRQQEDIKARQNLAAVELQARSQEAQADRMFRAQAMQYEAGNQAYQADQQRRYNAEALQFEAQQRQQLQQAAGTDALSRMERQAQLETEQSLLLSRDRFSQQTMTGQYAGQFGELAQRQFRQKQQEVTNAKMTLQQLRDNGQLDDFQYSQALSQIQASEVGLKAFMPTESEAQEAFSRSVITTSSPIIDPGTGRIKVDATGRPLEQQIQYRVNPNGSIDPLFHPAEQMQAQLDMQQMQTAAKMAEAAKRQSELQFNARRETAQQAGNLIGEFLKKGDPYNGGRAAAWLMYQNAQITPQEFQNQMRRINDAQAKGLYEMPKVEGAAGAIPVGMHGGMS